MFIRVCVRVYYVLYTGVATVNMAHVLVRKSVTLGILVTLGVYASLLAVFPVFGGSVVPFLIGPFRQM